MYDRERICDFGADPLQSESIIELHRLNGKYIISKTIVIYFDAEWLCNLWLCCASYHSLAVYYAFILFAWYNQQSIYMSQTFQSHATFSISMSGRTAENMLCSSDVLLT